MVHDERMKSPPRAVDRGRVTAAAVVAAVVLAVAGSAVGTAYDRPGTAVFAGTLSFAFAIAVVAVVGAIVTLAVPGNRVGWLMLAAAAVLGVGTAFTEAGIHGVVTVPGSVPGAAYLAALGPGLQAAGLVIAVVGVPAVFPDGRLPGPRWRWLAWSAAAAAACLFLGNVLSPTSNENRLAHWHSPLGLPVRYGNVAGALSAAGVLLAVAAAAGAIAGLVTRWRRGGPLVRQQLLLLALATWPPALVFLAILITNGVPGWIFGVVLLPLPAAIAIAILHHGLYDLRRAAHRTLLWLTMSAAVVGIYAAVVITVAALVPGSSRLVAFGAGGGAGRAGADPAARQAAARRDPRGLRPVARAVRGPGRPRPGPGSRRRHRPAAGRRGRRAHHRAGPARRQRPRSRRDRRHRHRRASPAASRAPTQPSRPGTASIPLLAYGTPVGSLTYRVPDRPLSAAEERLLHDLARQLGGALHARLLREDLQRARERLVLAREEERRRLRRDLHDGIGPALAGLTLKTETARALLPPGSDGASRQLHDLSEEIRRTVVDVRRLVEGLRPPALDELGLAGACAQAVERLTAGSGLAASVDACDDLPALPAAVEVAAYRIVVEAVTNTVRHARARHCQVSIACIPAGLAVEVTDDGTGLAASGHARPRPGHHAGTGRGTRRHRHGPGRLTRRHRPGAAAGRDRARAASQRPGGARVTRVLIVDDHPVFRDGLAGLLATLPEVEVTGTAGTAEEALAAIKDTAPDVVLMDINLPGASGVEATRRAAQIAPATAVLVVTMVDDDDTVFAALAAGARGYVLKGASADEIAAALRTVAAGGAVFGAGVASRLLAHTPGRSSGPASPSRPDDLTTREREVLDLLAEGASNQQIARSLGISLKTVQNHVSRILDKLQAADRTQAALRARGIPPQPRR